MQKLMKALLELRLQNAPQAVKNMHMKNLERMDFSSEDEFLEFLEEVEYEPGERGSKGKKEFKGLKIEPDKDRVKSVVQDLMK